MRDLTQPEPSQEAAAPSPLDSVQSCWIEHPGKGFIPSYRFFGLVAEGSPRPFRRFFQGERESVARYFMCLICETLFGEAPLLVTEGQDGTIGMRDNPEWVATPYLLKDDAGTYKMSDGSSLYDISFDLPLDAEPVETTTANTQGPPLTVLPDPRLETDLPEPIAETPAPDLND